MRAFGLLALVVAIGIVAWLTLQNQQQVQPAAAPTLPSQAATAQARQSLETIRAAIAAFHAQAMLRGGAPWPTLAQLSDGHSVLSGPLPENPLGGGWDYDEKTGEIRLNNGR